jgi:hypothetical protein
MAENGNGTTRRVLGWVAGVLAGLIAAVAAVQYSSNLDSNRAVTDKLNMHEVRITNTETCLKYMSNDISEIKDITKEIRRDQQRRERMGR